MIFCTNVSLMDWNISGIMFICKNKTGLVRIFCRYISWQDVKLGRDVSIETEWRLEWWMAWCKSIRSYEGKLIDFINEVRHTPQDKHIDNYHLLLRFTEQRL